MAWGTFLTGKEELFGHACVVGFIVVVFKLFYSVGIPQSIKSVLHRQRIGGHTSDHYRLAVSDKRILQNKC